MYRPNRIGPHSLMPSESRPFAIDNATVERGSLATGIFPLANFSRAVANISTMAETWQLDDTLLLAPDEQTVLAVKIGAGELMNDGEYVLSYGGAFVGFSEDEGIGVLPILGRIATQGVFFTSLTEYMYPPGEDNSQSPTSGTTVAPIYSNANGSVIMGDWRPENVVLTNDVAFGFHIINGSGGAATIENLRCSMSIHRYEYDLHAFDPNR